MGNRDSVVGFKKKKLVNLTPEIILLAISYNLLVYCWPIKRCAAGGGVRYSLPDGVTSALKNSVECCFSASCTYVLAGSRRHRRVHVAGCAPTHGHFDQWPDTRLSSRIDQSVLSAASPTVYAP
jgi:hypothetical protein